MSGVPAKRKQSHNWLPSWKYNILAGTNVRGGKSKTTHLFSCWEPHMMDGDSGDMLARRNFKNIAITISVSLHMILSWIWDSEENPCGNLLILWLSKIADVEVWNWVTDIIEEKY